MEPTERFIFWVKSPALASSCSISFSVTRHAENISHRRRPSFPSHSYSTERMHSGGSGDWKELPETATATAHIRKGPWTAEEDEVLMDYVKKHGPRDWSSIRSKGLLPRTGKSCRLRWVNKLRPDLKSGCKFTSDEERAVIEMQARFGNKWARIATFLPGRTDNDVKNFWSTRQKRLAKLLQTPLPVRSPRRQRKAPVRSQMPDFEDVLLQNLNSPSIDLIQFTEYYVNGKEFDYV